MPDISVIMPFVGEYPHILFTLQTVHDDLRSGNIDFEIIVIDNFCEDAVRHGTKPASDHRKTAQVQLRKLIDSGAAPWLRLLTFTDRLSHWGAKNLAIKSSESPYLMFQDAHVVPEPGALSSMFHYYRENEKDLNGTLHLPISNLLNSDARIYQMHHNSDKGLIHYKFLPLTKDFADRGIIQAPCMSSCGMMLHRKFICDDLQLWPEELGPYGGGENYLNFCLGLMGKNINVLTTHTLRHFAEGTVWARDYNVSNAEWLHNRVIATFLIGGEEWAGRFVHNLKIGFSGGQRSPVTKALDLSLQKVISSEPLQERRRLIEAKTVLSVDEFIEKWSLSPLSLLYTESLV